MLKKRKLALETSNQTKDGKVNFFLFFFISYDLKFSLINWTLKKNFAHAFPSSEQLAISLKIVE